ncbi:MAG: hypothetical protein AAGI36_00915 [Pseudomonadota bacterium]
MALMQEIEAVPLSYPTVTGLSQAATALDADTIWQRMEAYCRSRWTAREVVWIIEGEGDWTPPLSPASITLAEKWESDAWTAVTLPEGPYGYCLPSDGPYRISADVGGGTVPAAAVEAFRRLAEYLAEETDKAGVSSYTLNMGPIDESYQRSPTWVARAMQLSGAADLLRPYRRLK